MINVGDIAYQIIMFLMLIFFITFIVFFILTAVKRNKRLKNIEETLNHLTEGKEKIKRTLN